MESFVKRLFVRTLAKSRRRNWLALKGLHDVKSEFKEILAYPFPGPRRWYAVFGPQNLALNPLALTLIFNPSRRLLWEVLKNGKACPSNLNVSCFFYKHVSLSKLVKPIFLPFSYLGLNEGKKLRFKIWLQGVEQKHFMLPLDDVVLKLRTKRLKWRTTL